MSVPQSIPTPDPAETLLRDAQAAGASDLHIRPTASGYSVLVRKHGELFERERLPESDGARLLARLKILARLPVYRKDVPLEGRIALAGPDGERLLARTTFLPTIHGEKAAVRLFSADPKLLRLEGLGLPEEVVSEMEGWCTRRQGLVLLTGPAGSGKTTTIYAFLRRLHEVHGGLAIATLEDPVECDLGFASQTQVDPEGEITFTRGLRTLLRQDPDILAVGEIRDRDTAEIAVRAALSGHLVISTLHAAHTVEAPVRLLEMGVEPFLVASTLLGVVTQRLFRVRCAACGGEGCPRCEGRGAVGRRPLGECLVPDRGLRDLFVEHPHVERLREAAGRCLRITLAEDGRRRCERGEAAPAEIARILGEAEP